MSQLQQPQPTVQKQTARDFPCLFAELVNKYSKLGLKSCETKELQVWRHASSGQAVKRLTLYHDFMPELVDFQSFLNSYSICEKHYNQVISTNYFYQQLLDNHTLIDYKRRRIDSNSDNDSTFIFNSNNDQEIPLNNELQTLFGSTEEGSPVENQEKTQSVIDLTNTISKLKQVIGDQSREISELKKQLNEYCEELSYMKNLYQEQCKINEHLNEQWNSRYCDRHKRVQAVIDIARHERKSLYEDIESLISDNNRFSLENLLQYTPQTWLSKRNQVIVKFIETLTHNNLNTDSPNNEKLYKRVMAVDLIYGSRHGKYVSEMNLVASAIKYSITRSKTIINVDNHITNSGCYSRFQNWLSELSDREEPLPRGLLFLAFDNEQRGQKNYLDRGYNTVIFHTVTSFVAFNMDSQSNIQHSDIPWAFSSLNRSQYESLFDITSEMQEVIDKELHIYLSEILNSLNEEKLSLTNTIDSLIANTVLNDHCNKECPSCKERNIDNRKQVCPKCRACLPTLAELPKKHALKLETSKSNQLTIYKPYSIDEGTKLPALFRISITQKPFADRGVNIPEIFIPDPLDVNPNSTANVEKVLHHIEKISGVKDGIRKWVAVACDGIPYHRATKIKEKYPWLILIPGQLHEEMNMLRAYVELNWNVDLKQFAICQGYKTDNQLAYFKKCNDHHKAWDSVCNIYRRAIAMELMWPYVKSHSNPSVEGYLAWVEEQTDSIYRIKFEQAFRYLQAIINYRTAVRTNNLFLKRAARRAFSPVWSGRRHTIYRLIEITDEVQLMRLNPTIRNIIESNNIVSRSGLFNQHQGLDAVLEEINKTLKILISPVPQMHHWKIAARNCKKFLQLRNNFFETIGYNDLQTVGPRNRPDIIIECQRFRTRLRKENFVNPTDERTVYKSLGDEYELSAKLINFTDLAKKAREKYMIDVFHNKNNAVSLFRPIPITKQEAIAQEDDANLTKREIILKIETLLEQMNESVKKRYIGIKSERHSELLKILKEIRFLFNSDNEV